MIKTKINFQEAILLYRTRKHMNKAQLAKALGVSVNTVSTYENGKNHPKSIEQYEKLSEILGISLEHMYEFAIHYRKSYMRNPNIIKYYKSKKVHIK